MVSLAEASAETGYQRWAEAVYEALLPHADASVSVRNVVPLGSASRPLGRLATLLEKWDEAEQHFETALAANDRQGFYAWTAWTRLNYGEMLLKRAETGAAKPDDRERAVALLNEALAFATEAGMGKVQRDAEALLPAAM